MGKMQILAQDRIPVVNRHRPPATPKRDPDCRHCPDVSHMTPDCGENRLACAQPTAYLSATPRERRHSS